MPKRPHSPALDSVLSIKHAHTKYIERPNRPLVQNFDSILSDETVLTIFGYLDPSHLCLAQAVNRHWSRLATDNHLWRIMFLREFSQQRLRGSRGFSTSANREIRPLPSRARYDGDEMPAQGLLPENYTDWRWMYRISSNWSRGRCAVGIQRVGCHEPLLSFPSRSPPDQADCQTAFPGTPSAAHLILVGDLTVYSSHTLSTTSTVHVFRDSISSGLVIPYQPLSDRPVSVTALSLDHSSANIRLAVFYSDGTWNVYDVDYGRRSSSLVYSQPPVIAPLSNLAVIQAAYHHPLLVTLTSTFRMSIFYLPPAPGTPVLKHTLWSYSGFSPLTMTLSRHRTPDQYRVLLAHSTPIYPAHWAPSATDIMLSTCALRQSNILTRTESLDPTAIKILSSASTNNNLPVGWIPDGTPDGVPEELRLRWSRKVSHVSGIQTDGKFVVFASEDGGIQVYRLHRNAKLLYERTLFPPAHAPAPRALSVAESRCVCATRDGGLWVWDLESGMGVQAAGISSGEVSDTLDHESGTDETPPTIVQVAFDAHRVVAVDTGGAIRTYNFDI